jgi:hypothetical protein
VAYNMALTIGSEMLKRRVGWVHHVIHPRSAGCPSLLLTDSWAGPGRNSDAGSRYRRQRFFAVTQIAASFVLLVGASRLITTLIELQRTQTGLDTRHVLAVDVPPMTYGKTPRQVVEFYRESMRRIDALPGLTKTAFGMAVPWREQNGLGLRFSGDGHTHVRARRSPPQ